MFERFTKDARAAVTRAEDEARAAGSATVEAEHLLLATSAAVGIDRAAVVAALAAEWRASLDAAGVHLEPPPPVARRGPIRFGTSAKQALERSLRVAMERRDRRITAHHVALGVLGAEHGTVARAVRRAGIDTDGLWRGRSPSSPTTGSRTSSSAWCTA